MRAPHSAAMWLRIDRDAESTLSAQIADGLRTQILAGELGEAEQLPSSRTLAEALGVARSVVVRAYEQLSGEGYLDARAGSATRIAAGIVRAPLGQSDARSAAAVRAAARTPATRAPAAIRPAADGAAQDPSAETAPTPIDLRTGNPFVPAAVPEEWRRAVVAAAREPLSSYAPSPLGEERLREQIAVHARRSRGISCSPDDVIVTAGTAEALLLIGLALGQGSRIAVEDPGYPEAVRVLERVGAALTGVKVDPEGLTVARIPPGASAVLVTPSHQFPLGGRMPAVERTALVAWAAETGGLVIEDDYDSEFRHTGAALPAIAALEAAYPGGGLVAHIGSLNKSFSPAMRCGYLIATAGSPIWRALVEVRRELASPVPALAQHALAAFFSSGGFRRYVARTRREYRHRRELVLARFAAHGLADRLSGFDSGLHAVLHLPGELGARGVTGSSLAAELAREGVLVESIAEFRHSPAGGGPDDAIAIGYGAEPALRLEDGVDAIIREIQPVAQIAVP